MTADADYRTYSRLSALAAASAATEAHFRSPIAFEMKVAKELACRCFIVFSVKRHDLDRASSFKL
jgi:hypothetical protein